MIYVVTLLLTLLVGVANACEDFNGALLKVEKDWPITLVDLVGEDADLFVKANIDPSKKADRIIIRVDPRDNQLILLGQLGECLDGWATFDAQTKTTALVQIRTWLHQMETLRSQKNP